MPRYLVERTFATGVAFAADATDTAGADAARQCREIREIRDNNAASGVTWLQSYLTPDRTRTFCIYEAPSPEAIRLAARVNALGVDRITEIRGLDPSFFS